MFNHVITIALAASLAGAAALPTAASAEDNPSVQVAIDDLDLTSEAGRKALDRRIDAAARKLCAGRPGLTDLAEMRAARDCINTARASTKEQVRIALEAANARRVAVLAEKIGLLSAF